MFYPTKLSAKEFYAAADTFWERMQYKPYSHEVSGLGQTKAGEQIEITTEIRRRTLEFDGRVVVLTFNSPNDRYECSGLLTYDDDIVWRQIFGKGSFEEVVKEPIRWTQRFFKEKGIVTMNNFGGDIAEPSWSVYSKEENDKLYVCDADHGGHRR